MSGPRLACLHGFLGAPSSWDEVLGALGGPPCVRPSLDALGPFSDFEHALARLDAALDAAGASEGVHLVGYSLGARLALGLLAQARPGRFVRATLIGADPGLETPAARTARADADDALAARLLAEGLEAFVAAWEAEPLFASQAALPDAVRAAHRARRRAHDSSLVAAQLRALSKGRMPDFGPLLGQLTLPVDVVVGALDAPFLGTARRLADALPNARLVVVEGAGHDVVLERPAALAALLGSPPPSVRAPCLEATS